MPLLLLCSGIIPACAQEPSLPSRMPDNLIQVSPQIYSGAQPDGPEAFAAIAELGIKTIVSVDGATPNIALARQYGLRYIHIPFGYDGIDEHAGLALTRVMREADGPYYVHCHHGTIRGPAAAAIMCLAAGQTDQAGALQVLQRAGTSRDYSGIWRDVAMFEPPPPGAELPPLTEVAPVESLAKAMAMMDRAFDYLKRCSDTGWRTPVHHPDSAPAHKALLIVENLREAARTMPDTHNEQLKAGLLQAQAIAASLETSLRDQHDPAATSARFQELSRSCVDCHRVFR